MMNRPVVHSLPILLLLASCGDGGGGVTDTPAPVASVRVLPAHGFVVPEGIITLRADVRDAAGRRLDRIVGWTRPPGGAGHDIVTFSGPRVIGLVPGGPVTIRASVERRMDSAQITVVTSGSELVDGMLRGMDEFVTTMLRHNQDLLPLNPTLAELIRAKIALLERPELSSDIVTGLYTQGAATSDMRRVPIIAAFVADTMRPRVEGAVREIERALPVIESFMAESISASHVRMWYGFALGSRGGGGMLNVEDAGTYEVRQAGNLPPYLAIIVHELAHSFMGHEVLTQFLELYLYNVPRTGSTDVAAWSHTRGYVPDREDNSGIHAVLDIYRIIGHDAMADAFRALGALNPSFGQPLSEAQRSAIVDRARAERRAEVAAKVAMIGI